MIQKGSISQALMVSASQNSRLNFEIQFRNIEKTVVDRLNKEIKAVVATTSRHRDIEALQKDYNSLAEELPLYKAYLFGNEGNETRLQELGDVINDVTTIFATGDTALTADQASSINSSVEDIIDRISNLVPVSHPDINMPDIVFRVRGLMEGFENYTAEAGTIDAADAASYTNDNRPLYDAMTTLQSWVDTGVTITGNTVEYASNLIIDTQTAMFSLETRMTEIQAVDTAKVDAEVSALKERYAQLLQAISLSFEASAGLAEYLQQGLTKNSPERGSILNLFA